MIDQLHVPVVLLPEDAHRTGNCMGPTVSMDVVGSRMLARPVRSLLTIPTLLLLLLLLLLFHFPTLGNMHLYFCFDRMLPSVK